MTVGPRSKAVHLRAFDELHGIGSGAAMAAPPIVSLLILMHCGSAMAEPYLKHRL